MVRCVKLVALGVGLRVVWEEEGEEEEEEEEVQVVLQVLRVLRVLRVSI